MAKVKLDALVQITQSGEVTTINALAQKGMIEFREVRNFAKRGGGMRTAYFADLKGTNSGWEISRLAYLSRTGGNVKSEFV